ncbi:hypothetical protein F5Y18DRAFT_39800 [Xylariaceae sp. FL1019]|nr:hypothetical protein F5Y18DRAFT_39800 [Xylariaceae sp. FL1019]
MAKLYTSEELICLRDSPLCVKPIGLPPAEEWMGPPPENNRNSQGGRTGAERSRQNEGGLLDQNNRRPGVDRHMSRNSTNAEDIILAPPRTMFNSTLARTTKPFDGDKTTKDTDARDRFAFRPRTGDADANERFRERDGKPNFRRRGDGDQDGEGWSTVKPRKSFGAEGAERFSGRMGERPDRLTGDRRPRDGEERDNNTERPRRNFGEFARDKEGEESDKLRRNGLTRNRSDLPWTREAKETTESPQPRERFDRSKSWRDRAADEHADMQHDKPNQRHYDRRWDRDQRQEREPEWLDESIEEPPQAHTTEDFKKFMDSMKGKTSARAEQAPTLAMDVLKTAEKADNDETKSKSVKSTPALELAPDKFFAAFSQKPGVEVSNNEVTRENVPPPAQPKASRFQNFFSSQEEARRQPEPQIQAAPPPQPPAINPLLALAGVSTQQDSAEKVAFQALLQKLQKQTPQASTPPSGGFAEPPSGNDYGTKNVIASPNHLQSYGQERRDEYMPRAPPQGHEIHAPRPLQNNHFTGSMRPEQQMLHDLIGQRHPSQNSGRSRGDQPSSRNSNPNTEFLVSLMQQGRNPSETPRNEQLVMRMPQPSRPAQVPPTPDREPDFHADRGSSQYQAGGRPQGPPNFFDEPSTQRREPEGRPQQPTHILQRPGPPGLDMMTPNNWMQPGGQQLPNPGRPMIPPPGLAGNPRNNQMPGNYPSFPMGGFPPPDALGGLPPRNMGPPPGFYSGPPPGLMHPGMGGFPGPESLVFGYDGTRGMPPPGTGGPFRRS